MWIVNRKERWCVRISDICAICAESWRTKDDTTRILHTRSGQTYSVYDWEQDLVFAGDCSDTEEKRQLESLFNALTGGTP